MFVWWISDVSYHNLAVTNKNEFNQLIKRKALGQPQLLKLFKNQEKHAAHIERHSEKSPLIILSFKYFKHEPEHKYFAKQM